MTQHDIRGLGERMRLTRTRRKFSQSEMAAQLAVGRRTYQRYEDGLTEPPVSLLLDLSSEASVRFEWLVFGHGEPEEISSTQVVRTVRTLLAQTDAHVDRLNPGKRAVLIADLMGHIQQGEAVSEAEVTQTVAAALGTRGSQSAT